MDVIDADEGLDPLVPELGYRDQPLISLRQVTACSAL